MSKKNSTTYICSNCSYETGKWLGKCPSCDEWNSFEENIVVQFGKRGNTKNLPRDIETSTISNIIIDKVYRYNTGIYEFNRVLGGGVVPGSLILIGGEPGIGKSTLMLQVAENLSKLGKTLYVSGEESSSQIKMRSERLKVKGDLINFLGETSIEAIENVLETLNPSFLIIDSIQTCYITDLDKAPGSLLQIRETTNRLLDISKTKGVATFIVGHVTKDGVIAGPKILEHIVDTVLYFESNSPYLILRAVKNRFGNTDEIGVFAMEENGIKEIINPHEVFIDDEEGEGISVSCVSEGSRILILEVQALVSNATYSSPRRLVDGVEANKVNKILAVLEKRLGINLAYKDIYINLVGGIKVKEPGVDLAICASILSSIYNKNLGKKNVFIGELGLTGEIRKVSHLKERVSEALRMGFEKIYVPKKSLISEKFSDKQCIGVSSLSDFLLLLDIEVNNSKN